MAISAPGDISGLLYWGDGDNVITSGVDVITITRQDGTGGNITDGGTGQIGDELPHTSTVSGFGSVLFDGVDDFMGGMNLSSGDFDLTVGMYITLPAEDSNERVFVHCANTSASSSACALRKTTDNRMTFGPRSSPWATIDPDSDWAWGDTVFIVFTASESTDVGSLWINGVQKVDSASITAQPVLIGGITFGAAANGSTPFFAADCNLVSFVIYDNILNSTQVADVFEWLEDNYTPQAPTAEAGPAQIVFDTTGNGQASVTFDGSGSTDTDGTIDNYAWTVGSVELTSGAASMQTVDVFEGLYTVTLTVTDDDLATGTDAMSLEVRPKIRAYYRDTDATNTEHTFGFDLLPAEQVPLYNQVRVFRKESSGTVTELFPVGRPAADNSTQWDFDTTNTKVVTTVAYPGDEIIIIRETPMDKPIVDFTDTARLRAADWNLRGDQILHLCQELRELRYVAGLLGISYESDTQNTGLYTASHVGDGSSVNFSYESVEMMPREALTHETSLQVLVDGYPQASGWTADEASFTVVFDTAPADGVTIEIQRKTRIDRRWVQHTDASTFSSLLARWDRLNIKHIVEETPDFPTFLLDNVLSNRIFPRALNTLVYSGPGDRFFWGNLPYYGDGVITVIEDGVIQTEGTDYTVDFTFFTINFDTSRTGPITIQVTTPNHAFGTLSYLGGLSGLQSSEDPSVADPPVPPDTVITGDFTVVAKYVDSFNQLQNNSADEVGVATSGPGEPGAVLLLRSDQHAELDGALIESASFTFSVTGDTHTASNRIELHDIDPTVQTSFTPLTQAGNIITPAGVLSLSDGTGTKLLNSTDYVQAVADASLDRVYLMVREDPMPFPSAVSGKIDVGSPVSYEITISGSSTTEVDQQTKGTAGGVQKMQTYNVSLGTDLRTTVADGSPLQVKRSRPRPGVDINDLSTVLFSWDISSLTGGTVTSAAFLCSTVQWFGVSGDTKPTLKVARIPESVVTDYTDISWSYLDTSELTAWTGDATSDTGLGGRGDINATGAATKAWGGVEDGTLTESNFTVSGLKDMVQAALDAGEDTLYMLFYYEGPEDKDTTEITGRAELTFLPTSDPLNSISLTTIYVPA